MGMKRHQPIQQDEQGFAAIIVAVILLLVLSLITVGFAAQMRKEQRAALDNQLSTQAYYAAESGINDAVQALGSGVITTAKQTCPPDPQLPSNTVNAAENVSYSCLLIDPAPLSLEYGSIDISQSKVLQITGIDPTDPTETVTRPITRLHISWQPDHTLAAVPSPF